MAYQPLRDTLVDDHDPQDNDGPYDDPEDHRHRAMASLHERIALFLRGGTFVGDIYNNAQILLRYVEDQFKEE